MNEENKKKKRRPKVKKRTIVISLAIIAVLGSIFAYLHYFFVVVPTFEVPTLLKDTNTDPAVYETGEEMYEKMGDRFPYWFRKSIEYYGEGEIKDALLNDYTVVIPGLKATKTIKYESGEGDMCTSMVPQGLGISEKYMFISAYCYTHQHNSVIYVLDNETGEYIKTITLPNKTHAGGLAYDPENHILWVSDKIKKKASVSGMTIEAIEAYDNSLETPIEYIYRCPLDGLNAASYITYYNEQLIAGYFSGRDTSRMKTYQIKKDGSVSSKVKYKNKLSGYIQGATFDDFAAALSESYGPFDSEIQLFLPEDFADDTDYYDFSPENARYRVSDNQKLEQIVLVEYYGHRRLCLLYESAAFPYRIRNKGHIDRIIIVPEALVDDLVEKSEQGLIDLSDYKLDERID